MVIGRWAVTAIAAVMATAFAAGSAAPAATPGQLTGRVVTSTFAKVGLPLQPAPLLRPPSITYYIVLPKGSGSERVRVAILTSESAAKSFAATWTRNIRGGHLLSSDPNGLTRVRNVVALVFRWTSTSDRRGVARAIQALARK